jgi:hypothetical protein
MPAKRRPVHTYGVFVFAHTSTAKDDFTVKMLYLDSSERQAHLIFARAAVAAMTDPLVYALTMERDLEEVVRVRVEH